MSKKFAPKSLNGAELAGFIKERQSAAVRALTPKPTLVIFRDSDNPVIKKYVDLKIRYGEDIGAIVLDCPLETSALPAAIEKANKDQKVTGIIVQLPLNSPAKTDGILKHIAPEKDLDNLTGTAPYDAATATAIHWLLTGYDIPLEKLRLAIVGRGRLVGKPLEKIWRSSGYDVTVFEKGDDLNNLENFDLVVTATGVPRLIKSEMIKPGAVLVDAGTTSENGRLVGDLDEALYARPDLTALTPKLGGVGPLTIAVLFDHLLTAARNSC